MQSFEVFSWNAGIEGSRSLSHTNYIFQSECHVKAILKVVEPATHMSLWDFLALSSICRILYRRLCRKQDCRAMDLLISRSERKLVILRWNRRVRLKEKKSWIFLTQCLSSLDALDILPRRKRNKWWQMLALIDMRDCFCRKMRATCGDQYPLRVGILKHAELSNA